VHSKVGQSEKVRIIADSVHMYKKRGKSQNRNACRQMTSIDAAVRRLKRKGQMHSSP
jgi:hypothetical protein